MDQVYICSFSSEQVICFGISLYLKSKLLSNSLKVCPFSSQDSFHGQLLFAGNHWFGRDYYYFFLFEILPIKFFCFSILASNSQIPSNKYPLDTSPLSLSVVTEMLLLTQKYILLISLVSALVFISEGNKKFIKTFSVLGNCTQDLKKKKPY